MADNLRDVIKRRDAAAREPDVEIEVRPAKNEPAAEPEKKGRLRQMYEALKPREPAKIPPEMLRKAKGGEVPSGKALEDFRRQRDEQRRDKQEQKAPTTKTEMGKVFKKGGKVGSASRRGDGIAQRGKTKGRMV